MGRAKNIIEKVSTKKAENAVKRLKSVFPKIIGREVKIQIPKGKLYGDYGGKEKIGKITAEFRKTFNVIVRFGDDRCLVLVKKDIIYKQLDLG